MILNSEQDLFVKTFDKNSKIEMSPRSVPDVYNFV